MATTVISKTAAFTIADSDLSAGDDSVTYKCTGAFAVTIPSTGVGAGGEFYIESTDGLQTFTTTGATVSLPAGRELKPHPNGTGESSTISIVCEATGTYKADGDLNPTDWSEISFRAHRNGTDQTLTVFADWEKVALTTAEYDHGSAFDGTNNRWVCPEAGTYKFSGATGVNSFTAATLTVTCAIYVNGTIVASGSRVSTDSTYSFVSSNVNWQGELDVGDNVELYIYQNESTSETLRGNSHHTYLEGHKVGGIKGATGDFGSAVYQEPLSIRVSKGGSDQTVSTTSYTTVEMSNIIGTENTGGWGSNFDTSTYTFTAPVDGLYRIHLNTQWQNITSGAEVILAVQKNTVDSLVVRGRSAHSTGWQTSEGETQLELVAGDEIRSRIQAGDSSYTVRTSSYMYIELLDRSPVVLSPQGVDHAIYVEATNSQSVSASTPFTVAFDTIVNQTNLDFDLTNNKFIAPTSGWYQFESRITVSSLAANARVYSYLTRTGLDSIYFEDWNQRDSTGVARWGGSQTCYLEAGTECTLVIVSTSTCTIRQSISSESFLSIVKLSGSNTGIEHDRYEIGVELEGSGTNQVLTAADTWEKVTQIGTPIQDKGGNWDSTNNRFMVPVSGWYECSAYGYILGSAATDGAVFKIYKNGADHRTLGAVRVATSTNYAMSPSGSISTYLKAGDYIELWWKATAASSTLYTSATNSFRFTCVLSQADAKAECSCSAYRSGTQSIGGGANTKVTLNAVNYNYGNAFDYTTNYRFNVPEDGRYTVKGSVGSVTTLPDNTYMQAIIYVDGVQEYAGPKAFSAGGATSCSAEANVDLDLTAGQYVELYVFQNSGGSMSFELNTKLDIRREVTTPTEVPQPYNPVVYEYEFTTAATFHDVPSHLLGEKQYRIEVSLKEDTTGTDTSINLYVNGDTTATNYYSQQLQVNGTSVVAARNNTAYIGFIKQNTGFTTGTVSVINGDLYGNFHCTRLESSVPRIFMYSLSNAVTTFNSITDIRISGATDGLGVGTRIRILRD